MSEPNAPWEQFPEWPCYHVMWRMGPGEAWLYGVFFPFWTTLDRPERRDYLRRHRCSDRSWASELLSDETVEMEDADLELLDSIGERSDT